jgi:predicted ATPase
MTLAQAQQPLVFIVSGPSGSGKSTLVQKMLEVPGTMFSVSCTTRPPRTTESAGKWYDFISEEEFDRRVRAGEFLDPRQRFQFDRAELGKIDLRPWQEAQSPAHRSRRWSAASCRQRSCRRRALSEPA